MLGVAPRSSRINLKVPVSSGRSGKIRHTSPLLMTARSLPYRALSATTAGPGEAAPGGATAAGGTLTIAGAGAGCVSGAGREGPAPGPEGSAKFSAGPEGTSGTVQGGTGGGRSENIWALAGAIRPATSTTASAGHSRPLRRDRKMPSPPEVMVMLFTEKAANSSRLAPVRCRGLEPALLPAGRSPPRHNPRLPPS